MVLLSHFDIYSDFYADPELRSIFSEEYENNVSSATMWAIALYHHPKSKYYSQDNETKKLLIEKDYLKSTLDLKALESTTNKFLQFCLTKPQRFLKSWEDDFEERDAFMKSLPYDIENYKIKEDLMGNRTKLWQGYLDILKKVSEEVDTKTVGDSELSLKEKGLLT